MKHCLLLLLCIASLSPTMAKKRVFKGHARVNVLGIMLDNKVATQTVTTYKYDKKQTYPIWESSHTDYYDIRMRDTLVVMYDSIGNVAQKARTWYIAPTGRAYYKTEIRNAADSITYSHEALPGTGMFSTSSDSIYIQPPGYALYTYLPNHLIETATYYTPYGRQARLRIAYRYIFSYTYRSE